MKEIIFHIHIINSICLHKETYKSQTTTKPHANALTNIHTRILFTAVLTRSKSFNAKAAATLVSISPFFDFSVLTGILEP